MAPLEDLAKYIEGFYISWRRQTRFYGTVSSVIRVALIVSTAIVGAEKTLEQSMNIKSPDVFPILALAVAIGTALDAWLKPREKWRGFMSDRDDVKAQLIKVQASDQNDLAKHDAYLDELRAIQRRHVEKNVY